MATNEDEPVLNSDNEEVQIRFTLRRRNLMQLPSNTCMSVQATITAGNFGQRNVNTNQPAVSPSSNLSLQPFVTTPAPAPYRQSFVTTPAPAPYRTPRTGASGSRHSWLSSATTTRQPSASTITSDRPPSASAGEAEATPFRLVSLQIGSHRLTTSGAISDRPGCSNFVSYAPDHRATVPPGRTTITSDRFPGSTLAPDDRCSRFPSISPPELLADRSPGAAGSSGAGAAGPIGDFYRLCVVGQPPAGKPSASRPPAGKPSAYQRPAHQRPGSQLHTSGTASALQLSPIPPSSLSSAKSIFISQRRRKFDLKYRCKFCEDTFPTEWEVSAHVLSDHPWTHHPWRRSGP